MKNKYDENTRRQLLEIAERTAIGKIINQMINLEKEVDDLKHKIRGYAQAKKDFEANYSKLYDEIRKLRKPDYEVIKEEIFKKVPLLSLLEKLSKVFKGKKK